MLIGIFLLIIYFFKLTFISNIYSIPAFNGYFKAANFIIFVEQLAKTLGIHLEGEKIFNKIYYLFSNLNKTNLDSFYLGVTVIVLLTISKVLKEKKFKDSVFL